jgi:uncharacterized protein
VTDPFTAFAGQKYLSLETFRRNGTGVQTPLWFAAAPGEPVLYIYTLASSGKAKRLRRSAAARIAPCDARGGVTGPWMAVQATIVTGEAAARAMSLLDRKYWPWKAILNVAARLRPWRERVVIAIKAV